MAERTIHLPNNILHRDWFGLPGFTDVVLWLAFHVNDKEELSSYWHGCTVAPRSVEVEPAQIADETGTTVQGVKIILDALRNAGEISYEESIAHLGGRSTAIKVYTITLKNYDCETNTLY